MEGEFEKAVCHIDDLLNIPRQVWLLGAGVSKDAGVPLMYPLTDRVEELLKSGDDCFEVVASDAHYQMYSAIKSRLPSSAHVEHVLSQIGDLISLVERTSDLTIDLDASVYTAKELRALHRHVQLAIRHTVEFGYHPPSNGTSARAGTPENPIIDISHHSRFVRSLFLDRRAGLELNPPVRFITTNYDTLLEDALSSAHIGCVDGFAGGATGFWDPRNTESRLQHARTICRHTATMCKLHGSIDWVSDPDGVVMRVRTSAIKMSDESQELLIYPQATKYQVTQRDPFASLFLEFRTALCSSSPTVLVVCGYSFGDDHVNEEIERALKSGPTTLTIIALCRQSTNKDGALLEHDGLPNTLVRWLLDRTFGDRVIVAGSNGFYRGGTMSRVPTDREYSWWTFGGISDVLSRGAEAML